MSGDDFLHEGEKGAAVTFAALVLLQLSRQGNSVSILIGIDQQANEFGDVLGSRGIFFEQLPDDRLGVAEAIGCEQGFAVGIANILRSRTGVDQGFEHEDRGANLTLLHQTLAVGQGDLRVGWGLRHRRAQSMAQRCRRRRESFPRF